MDKSLILSEDVQDFIRVHESDDLTSLALRRDQYPDLPLGDIIEQIKARKKAKSKLPLWYNSKNILYPSGISLEQASSQLTAAFKASLFSGTKSVDLTGGFGIDSYYISQVFTKHDYVEKNSGLTEIVKHNLAILGVKNIKYTTQSAEDYLANLSDRYDLIYIDPDRRPTHTKVTGFEQSEPNIKSLLKSLLKIGRHILIKASPMMDIHEGLNYLTNVKTVIILSVSNEVKELIFWLEKDYSSEVEIRCVDMSTKENIEFNFYPSEELQEELKVGPLGEYLYEPNAVILKSGGFKSLGNRFDLLKLHRNTNLFTSQTLNAHFPGRVFNVLANLSYNKKEILPFLSAMKANLSTRNFIDTPKQMKKKLGLSDGGEYYLFGYRDYQNKNRVAICTKT